MDDVIIFSPTFEGMLENLRLVFLRLQQVKLKVNPEKCNLFRKSVTFLGHVISGEGVMTDPKKNLFCSSRMACPHDQKTNSKFFGLLLLLLL